MSILGFLGVALIGLFGLAPADVVAQAVRPIEIPAALRARTARVAPSGLVWSKELKRYLVVADEFGPASSNHQPSLLTMSSDGKLDDAPLPIQGLDELDDAESICAGPGGQFFLTTSHSVNHEGVVPPARRQLLLLSLSGGKVRVTGRADLRDAHDKQGRNVLQLAGLPGDGSIAIDAIGYRDGKLLIGLKSPLRADGSAVILRMRDPVDVLRRGEITDGDVELETAALLPAPNGAPQGITDLVALPDGSIMVVANSPKGEQADGGGSLYQLKEGVPPKRLRSFSGQRPEGIGLSSDGKGLVIVLDGHDRPPLWVQGAIPR